MGGKFYGPIGYAEGGTVETKPGVWTPVIIERNYSGDVVRNTSKIRDGEHLNDNLIIDNKLSIVADPYAYEHFYSIRYVKWMGVKWKVSLVDVQYPRLILTMGEVFNE